MQIVSDFLKDLSVSISICNDAQRKEKRKRTENPKYIFQ